MNKVAAFALRRKNSILSMSEKMFCPPQPLRFWITPACAGKSRRKTTDRFCSRDHPRLCGEKLCPAGVKVLGLGSPPRMRGKGVSAARIGCGVGITPACAGKRPKSRKNGPNTWDHLRVCGEKQSGADQQTTIEGSPPRMRGKDQACSRWRYPDGITPAYAGKSSSRRQRMPHSRDHPRLCGEKLERSDPRFPSRGSPPRVRGKVPSSI